jgi:hypothetical protein
MAGEDKPHGEEPTTEGAGGDEEIRRRAYEISQSAESGTAEENWHRAAHEVTKRNETR